MATTLYAKAQNVAILKSELTQLVIGVSLLAASSQVSIPLQPVPITMQTVAVLLIGLFYPTKTAVKTMASYIAVGALGLPVFANFSGGLHVLMGPTAGYIWGFLASVATMCFFREKVAKDTLAMQLINCALGTLLIYACGVSWLSCFVGVAKAVQFGLLPFIIPGCVKAAILSSATQYVKSGRCI